MTTSTRSDRLRNALEPIRQTLQLDGADLRPIDLESSVPHVALDLRGVSCLDCVMPKPTIEAIVLDALRSEVPGLGGVVLDDPRDDETQ